MPLSEIVSSVTNIVHVDAWCERANWTAVLSQLKTPEGYGIIV